MVDLQGKIKKERDRLSRLVNKAIKNDQAIGTNNAILAQSRKLDELIRKLANQTKNNS